MLYTVEVGSIVSLILWGALLLSWALTIVLGLQNRILWFALGFTIVRSILSFGIGPTLFILGTINACTALLSLFFKTPLRSNIFKI